MIGLLSSLRLIGGLLCVITLGFGGYFFSNNYDALDCGDMKLGITLGLSSILVFLFNIITYLCTCNKCWIISICGLFLLGSTGYNIYITENIDKECKKQYEEKDLWTYYTYMYIALIASSSLFIVITILTLCCKKSD